MSYCKIFKRNNFGNFKLPALYEAVTLVKSVIKYHNMWGEKIDNKKMKRENNYGFYWGNNLSGRPSVAYLIELFVVCAPAS